jgi:hypothetical protein
MSALSAAPRAMAPPPTSPAAAALPAPGAPFPPSGCGTAAGACAVSAAPLASFGYERTSGDPKTSRSARAANSMTPGVLVCCAQRGRDHIGEVLECGGDCPQRFGLRFRRWSLQTFRGAGRRVAGGGQAVGLRFPTGLFNRRADIRRGRRRPGGANAGLTTLAPLDPATKRTGARRLGQMLTTVTAFEYASVDPRRVVFAAQRSQ